MSQGTAQRTARRELLGAVLACAVGASLALFAVGRSWARGSVDTGLATVAVSSSGGSVAPAVVGFALLGLAGAVAIFATRAIGRRIVGVLVALGGVGIVVAVIASAGDPAGALGPAAAKAAGRTGAEVTAASASVWPWFAAAGGLLMLLGGAVTAARGPMWPGMSSRYERAASSGETGSTQDQRPVTSADPPRSAWEALDRGEDPTV